MKPLEKFLRTRENWFSSYFPLESGNPLNEHAVKVRAVRLRSGDWRVNVWGNDDFGLEKDGHTQEEAKALFDSLQDYITQAQLEELGFARF